MTVLSNARHAAAVFLSTIAALRRAVSRLLDITHLHEVPGYLLAVLFILMPISWVGGLLNWALALTPVWPGLTAIGMMALLLLVFATAMTNERFLRDIRSSGMRWPTVFSVALAWLAVVVFGGISCAFERLQWVAMVPSVALTDGCATKYADMYLWHLMDAIPAIKFNETVGWKVQYAYSGAVGGWLLVAFKVLVIASVIGSFLICGRLRRERQHDQVADAPPAASDAQVLA